MNVFFLIAMVVVVVVLAFVFFDGACMGTGCLSAMPSPPSGYFL